MRVFGEFDGLRRIHPMRNEDWMDQPTGGTFQLILDAPDEADRLTIRRQH